MTEDGTEETHYYLPEKQLDSIDEDEFDHTAHVETLEDIIYNVESPWHIGLYGTWGSGKSTIVRFLYQRIRESQSQEGRIYPEISDDEDRSDHEFEDTLCVSINAWKHAEGSVRTELLLDLNQSIKQELESRFDVEDLEDDESGESDGVVSNLLEEVDEDSPDRESLRSVDDGVLDSNRIINELYDVEVEEQEQRRSIKESLKHVESLATKSILGLSAIIAVLGVALYLVSLFDIFSLNSISGLRTIGSLFIGSGIIGMFLRGPISLLISDFRRARRDVQRTMANPQKDWSGAYESLFDTIIEDASDLYDQYETAATRAGTESNKEDPDGEDDASEVEEENSSEEPEEQSNSEESEEGSGFDRLVITIDDLDRCNSKTAYEILIALKSFLNHEKCIYIIPCDEDALYEHLEAADTGEYLNQPENQQNFLDKFFETEIEIPEISRQQLMGYFDDRSEELERDFNADTLDVLKYANLKTPRRVTRSLNRLVTLDELASNRSVFENSDEELREPALALVAVLKEDFPRFHTELEKDPEQLIEIYDNLQNSHPGNFRQELHELLSEMGVQPERQDDLIEFLESTATIMEPVDDARPYLRLSGSTRDPLETFQVRLERGRVDALRSLIYDVPAGDIEQEKSEDHDPDNQEDSTTITRSDFADEIVQSLSSAGAEFEILVTTVEIIDCFQSDQRGEISQAFYDVLQNEESEEFSRALFRSVEREQLNLILEQLGEQAPDVAVPYVQSLFDQTGLRIEDLSSLEELPEFFLLDQDVQEAFNTEVIAAQKQGRMAEEEIMNLQTYLKRHCPALYTPKLIQET